MEVVGVIMNRIEELVVRNKETFKKRAKRKRLKDVKSKAGSLREQFNYYRRRLKNRLLEEQAYKTARGVGTIEERIFTLFDFDKKFNEIYSKGITRKIGDRTVRYTGEEAIKIEIESYRRRASKSEQARIFIGRYVVAMRKVGFSNKGILEAKELLESVTVDRLTYLIDAGYIPEINYLYADVTDEENTLLEIRDAILHGVTEAELSTVKSKARRIKANIKERLKILDE